MRLRVCGLRSRALLDKCRSSQSSTLTVMIDATRLGWWHSRGVCATGWQDMARCRTAKHETDADSDDAERRSTKTNPSLTASLPP